MIFSGIFFPILCQNKNIAIVANLNLSGKINRNSIDQLTNLLKKLEDTNVALIFYYDSTQHSSDENDQIQSLLSNIKMPYNIVLDDNSNHLTEDFISSQDGNLLMGINPISSLKSSTEYFRIESLNRISEVADLDKLEKIFLFTNNVLNSLQNSQYLFNRLKNKYIFSFYPTEKNLSSQINNTTNVTEIGIPQSITNEEISFYLIQQDADTIRVLKSTAKNETLETSFSVSLNELKHSNVEIEVQSIDPIVERVNYIDFNSSSTTQSLISENKLYTMLDNGLIYLNDFDGKEKFVTELIGNIKTDPGLYKDLILAATFDGDLYSVNSNNGEILQVVGIGENITSEISVLNIEIQNSKKIGGVFGTSNGNIFCYDAFTFEQLWKNHISDFPLVSKPLLLNDKIIFTNINSSLYCVNSKSGSIIWKHNFSDQLNEYRNTYPSTDGKNVFSISPERNLFAIDLLLGKISWSINAKQMLNQFYLSSDKEKLFLINEKGLMTVFSARDGKEIKKIDFKKSFVSSFIINEMQDILLVGFSDGSLHYLDKNFIQRQLFSSNQIPISSINAVTKNRFTVKNVFGQITFYEFK